MREPAQKVVHGRGKQFAAIFGIHLRLHIDQRDRLIAIIRDYEEDRHVAVVAVVDAEDRSFVFQVVGIDCDRNFFHGMIVVRRVGAGGLRRGHHKFFGRDRAKAADQHKGAD